MRKSFYLLLIGLLTCTAIVAQTEDVNGADVRIRDGWVRSTAVEGMTMEAGSITAAYMTIENIGKDDLRLVAASTPITETVEIHETTLEDDVMRMNELEDGLLVEAESAATLEPGGLHIMLIDLERDLLLGEAISLTLTFALTGDEDEQTMFDVVTGLPVLEMMPPDSAPLIVNAAWTRPTVADAEAAEDADVPPTPNAIYMQITNPGEDDLTLVSAVTDTAAFVEIHETMLADDVMRMAQLEDGLTIPAGETVTLEPGGLHIMLIELQQNFVPDEAILLELTLDSGAMMTVAVPVYDRDMFMMMIDD